ncbi:uncharacterized protein [Erythrolamprus reginae]|uniref:uncharacterized protein n=1 Tax=Erythrolamprus reginae TaxID=121349 RepID=UPI00396C867F
MLTWLKGLLQLFLLHTAWKMGSGQLHYSVLEESQHGTFVGRIAQDLGLEVSELVPRVFRMLSKGEKDYFEVNLQNGILFVNSRIDREELCAKNADCVLHLEVIVEKPLRFFHVEVDIKDINDNAPIFSAMEKILSISEQMTGTRFSLEGASDADIDTNALLTYKLSPNNHFALDTGNNEDESKSVVLLLKAPLDREESPVHHLVLTATDGGEPKLTGTVQLVIKVLDVNDNPPLFNQSAYRVKLLENTASGSLVITLNAIDLDEGINGEISYFFTGSLALHFRKMFGINSDTGEIRVIGKLDYEESKFYELPIVAEDKGSSQLSGHCKVLIEVLDMNDNIPELSVNSLSIPLPEDSPPGTVVAIISASDKDSGNNGQINCFLWPTGVPFKLESTFKNYYSLIVGAPLDREQVAEYKMIVTVEDQGVPPLSSSLTLLVPISDINDNAPAFTQPSYTVFVKENNPPGAHIFTVSASDPDVAENALITYWIDEKLWPLSSYISVHSESGKLYALQSLDYEELKLLEFQVRAKDAGLPSLCGNATVQVFVVDENDNAPAVLASSEENLILLEVPVMPGHILGKIHALDADSGYNAWLRYELVEESNVPWTVGQYSGEVSTKYSLDESEGNKILVLVKDHGKPQLSATATLSVSLMTGGQIIKTDINLQRSGESFVPLVDSINIYLIIAICSVSSLFLLATLIYVALRCHCKAKEPMVYGPGMATLVCASEVGSWSYSNRHSHILAGVSAEAGAKSDLMIFSPNIPVFAHNEELIKGVDVPPDSAKKVSPQDPSRTAEQRRPPTALEEEPAEPTPARSLQEHSAHQPKSSVYPIFVKNVSAMLTWPKGLLQLFLLHTAWKMGSGQLHYSVLEESQHGTFVGRIAQDLGLEVSELVPRMFRMLSKGQKDYFEVNLQNGILFVNSRIDREELCAKNADCVLHLEVIVEKPLRFFHVEVDIKDINDNAPIFLAREQILSIAEFVTFVTLFPLKGASDADIGTNALLTYKLSPNNHFVLDSGNDEDESKSVVLLLKIPLDREESPVHHLVLTATDGGEPKLTGTVQLVINVLDVNDNPPVFNQSVYRVKLPENTASGSLVITLNATDLDEGINSEISYFFTDSLALRATKIFSINLDTGEIRVIGKLDYEESKFYELQITAEDTGNFPLSGQCKVLVDVLDMNDNIPELSVNSLSVPLPEDSPPGTVVAIISASDRDSGNNGQINCFLLPTGVPFKLESTFKNYYSLIVGSPLDREQMAEYRMVLTVEDHGVPPLSSSITLLVPISDINDNAPAFTQPSYTVFVKENNPPGAHIFTLSAADPDVAENGLITYWIDEKLWPLSSYISVHSESGKLYVLQSLDYEELKLLEFQVRAKDAGIPSLYGNVTVQVFVLDVNDNAPVVSNSPEENLVRLVVPVMPGHIVGKIHALDADSGYNGWLNYEFIEENNGPWSVGKYSGEPKPPNPDWRYSASLRAGIQGAVHIEETGGLRVGSGGPEQQWPTVSSATTEPEAGEVSPPVGAGVNSNSWTFKYGPGNSKQPGPSELPDKFIIPGSPAIISIRQDPPNSQTDKSDFITFGKKEETKKKKKKKKGNKDKKEKTNCTTDNSDQ